MIEVKIKKCSESAKLPEKMTNHSSGYDIFAAILDEVKISPDEIALIPAGFALEIPEGYEAQIRPRSGLALKNGISILNSPGTIDADYRGEVKIILINQGKMDFVVTKNMRIAQIVFAKVPHLELIEVKTINNTGRDSGGFGHTGLSDTAASDLSEKN